MTRKLVIISGTRGAGKGTLVDAILNEFPSMRKMVAHTTRPPRDGEVDGRSYHFVTKQEIDRLGADGKMFWVEQIGPTQWSGLSFEEILKTKTGVIDVYPEGALRVREWTQERGGSVLLLAVFAPAGMRMGRLIERAGMNSAEGRRLFFEDPVSGETKDYIEFDRCIDNGYEGKPEYACAEAVEAVRAFLNGDKA